MARKKTSPPEGDEGLLASEDLVDPQPHLRIAGESYRTTLVVGNLDETCLQVERSKEFARDVYARDRHRGVLSLDESPPRFVQWTPALCARWISREFEVVARDPKSDSLKPANPPELVCMALTQTPNDTRDLHSVVDYPIRLANGEWVTDGYNPSAKVFVKLDSGIEPKHLRWALEEGATQEAAKRAKDLLFEVVKDFPFADEKSFSVWVAAALTPFFRPGSPDTNAPGFIFGGSQGGLGKSLLVDLASLIITGAKAAPVTMSKDPRGDEQEKRMRALAKAGKSIVKVDNITTGSKFGGSPWDEILTGCGRYEGRALGTEDLSSLRFLSTLYFSGNNVTLTGELSRRVLWCALESRECDPESRTFAIPDLAEHVKQNRSKLLAALIVIFRAADAARARGETIVTAPFGSFEEWEIAIGGACVYCGLPDPATARKVGEDAGDDGANEQVVQLVEEFSRTMGMFVPGVTSGQIRERPTGEPESWAKSRRALQEAIDEAFGDQSLKSSRALSACLHRIQGRWFRSGVRLIEERDQHLKQITWRVERK